MSPFGEVVAVVVAWWLWLLGVSILLVKAVL